MQRFSQKITACSLVLLFAIPLLYTVVLTVQQKVIQINSRLKLQSATTINITISKKEVSWVKKGKEVLINGKYFDVSRCQDIGDHYVLTGYYDKKEDKLVARIKKVFLQQSHAENPVNQVVLKFLFFPIFYNHVSFSVDCWPQMTSSCSRFFAERIPDAPAFSLLHPPQFA